MTIRQDRTFSTSRTVPPGRTSRTGRPGPSRLSPAADRRARVLVAITGLAALLLAALLVWQLPGGGGPTNGAPIGVAAPTSTAAVGLVTPTAVVEATATVPPSVGGAVDPRPSGSAGATVAPSPTPTEARPRPATATPTAVATPEATIRPDPPVIAGAEPDVSTIVQQGTSGRREVALTFDGGDDRGNAEAILELLADRGIVASFGITGEWAAANPDLVERMVADGHQVFNHTWSHQSFTGFSTGAGDPGTDYRLDELERTHAEIADLGDGYDDRPYWRPPYGDLGPQTLRDADAAGYGITVMWSVDSLGWQDGETGETVTARVLDGVEPGAIVLLHVGEAATADYDALPGIIDGLEADGYTFVTVEQVLQP
ncbi:MAG TPA: polysaccharide deacetylase family protein [Thermomicrobiales bacterium]|jgi:peptidoglycan/xylan/chitin deacetylase (PgdA/CDA1 family)|nr:polysaccharide deacetylase family protein [Thermomicrobiales bacterium]